jgi:hypothetical protein
LDFQLFYCFLLQALDDPAVKSKVADTIAWVLQEKYAAVV